MSRTTGVLADARHLGAGDHVCWAYDDEAAFASMAAEYLADGVARGQRTVLLTASDGRALGRSSGDLDRLLASGRVELGLLDDRYDGDPAAQVATFAALADEAVADGFTGLRVVADVTTLVTTTAQREAFGTYEHLVDRLIADRPITGMCAIDRRALPDVTVELGCLHPASNQADLPFRCFAGDDGRVRLDGEVDDTRAGLFAATLAHVVGGRDELLRVDGRRLDFIDHRGLLALAGAADDVELETPFVAARRLAELLGLDVVVRP